MIPFNKFKSLPTTDKIQTVCDDVNTRYEGNIKPLIDHTVNAYDSKEFSQAYKRVKEHAASLNYEI